MHVALDGSVFRGWIQGQVLDHFNSNVDEECYLTLCFFITGIASLESELSSDDNNPIMPATFGISINTTEKLNGKKKFDSRDRAQQTVTWSASFFLFFYPFLDKTAAGATQTKFIAAFLRFLWCSTAGQECSLAIDQLLTDAGLMELWRVGGFCTSNAGLTCRMRVT